jgi:hypothetical protein
LAVDVVKKGLDGFCQLEENIILGSYDSNWSLRRSSEEDVLQTEVVLVGDRGAVLAAARAADAGHSAAPLSLQDERLESGRLILTHNLPR